MTMESDKNSSNPLRLLRIVSIFTALVHIFMRNKKLVDQLKYALCMHSECLGKFAATQRNRHVNFEEGGYVTFLNLLVIACVEERDDSLLVMVNLLPLLNNTECLHS